VPPASRPAALRGKGFRARDVLALGLLTRDALRSSAWRRLYRGVYADAALPDDADVRIAGAALIVPATAVFSGRTAAHLLGAPTLLEVTHPIEVTVPPEGRFGPVTGLRIRHAPLPAADVRAVGRRRCTSELRTALDLARFEPLMDAVVALDVLVGRAVVTEADLCAAVG